MNYVFDTSAILYYLKDPITRERIISDYQPFEEGNNAIISIVTLGEIMAIAQKNSWGNLRIEAVNKILKQFLVVEIKYGKLLEKYAEIEAFSQRKHKRITTSFTARNMGKNDVWIAATAAITDAILITSDKDFAHLEGVFFEIVLIS
ncbi:MAG: PIN domain-containing protein [Saprospiraceae bacterium]